jgi:tRNA1Val (adenine37-N6)-methyltransferase
MKVSTDACLLGAWCRAINQPKTIVDIGTGTGVLSLMLAQKFNAAKIDAVEIEHDAFVQASNNFIHSNFKNRITCYHQNIQQFAKNTDKKYDIIISNPPYFDGDLQTENEKANVAKHSAALTLDELINCIYQLLADDGICYLILPSHRINELKLPIEKICYIKDNPKANIKRAMVKMSKKSTSTTEEILLLKNENQNYTYEFIELMKPYYLNL